jgi:hypothetical protein
VEDITGSGTIRILDAAAAQLAAGEAPDAASLIESAAPGADTVVLDGTVTQQLLDLAAERGISTIYASDQGDIVKQPASVRIRTLEDV